MADFGKFREAVGAIEIESSACFSNVREWISTGIPQVDALFRGPNTGVPVGKVISIVGEPGVGKSTLVCSILSTTQKVGGTAVLIDSEFSLDGERATNLGVNVDDLIYFHDVQLENMAPLIEKVVVTSIKLNPNALICVAVDTISAIPSESDLTVASGSMPQPGLHARYLSHAFRRLTHLIAKNRVALILVHQPRTKIQKMGYGSPLTWLGKAPTTFHSCSIMQLARVRYMKRSQNSDPYGIEVKARMIRNKIGIPLKSCNFLIDFNTGVDGVTPLLLLISDAGLAKKKGGWYTLPNEDKIQAAGFKEYYKTNTALVDSWVQEAYALGAGGDVVMPDEIIDAEPGSEATATQGMERDPILEDFEE